MVKALIFIISLLLVTVVQSEEYNHYSYWFYTGNSITIGWDAAQNAVEYQIELYDIEHKVPVAIGRTSLTQIQLVCPRSGHYFARVKTIGASEDSQWSETSNSQCSTVAGVAKSWWIYCRIAPPTGGVIE